MIECPWCANKVILVNNICPECKQEVLPEHLNSKFEDDESPISDETDADFTDLSIEDLITNKFKCSKCGNIECYVKEVAMTGAGLSKIFDIQYNHYLFVTCTNCGFTEAYNPDVLRGHKAGQLGTIIDILFGG